MATDNVELISGAHAIEMENFSVVFRTPLNSGDEGRFQEGVERIRKFFGAIEEHGVVQFFLGAEPPSNDIPPPIMKTLREFGRDGSAHWTAQFGDNAVSVTCNKYEGWADSWPKVEERLKLLLDCVDPFKFVSSIEYGVVDTLRERITEDIASIQLLTSNIFKKGSWVPERFTNEYLDPRWDFSGGAFVGRHAEGEILERLEAKGFISSGYVVVSVNNSFSLRFTKPIRLKDILASGGIAAAYNKFHDDNKVTIRAVLNDELLNRMGL